MLQAVVFAGILLTTSPSRNMTFLKVKFRTANPDFTKTGRWRLKKGNPIEKGGDFELTIEGRPISSAGGTCILGGLGAFPPQNLKKLDIKYEVSCILGIFLAKKIKGSHKRFYAKEMKQNSNLGLFLKLQPFIPDY